MTSTYQPLFDCLAAASGDEVTLTYKEVTALIGGPLPETAVLQTGWWTRKGYDHVQAWRALGWRAHASAAKRRVIFTRDAEEESDAGRYLIGIPRTVPDTALDANDAFVMLDSTSEATVEAIYLEAIVRVWVPEKPGETLWP